MAPGALTGLGICQHRPSAAGSRGAVATARACVERMAAVRRRGRRQQLLRVAMDQSRLDVRPAVLECCAGARPSRGDAVRNQT